MKVTEKDVQYVADLANLELTPEEQSRMVKELNSILEHIDRLNQLDTKDVPPRKCRTNSALIRRSRDPSDLVTSCARMSASVPAARGGNGECTGFGWSVLQSAEGD